MPAAGDQGLQFHPLVDHQRTGAFRPAQLVRGKGQGMHSGPIEGAKIDAPLAEGLHRVGMEPRAR